MKKCFVLAAVIWLSVGVIRGLPIVGIALGVWPMRAPNTVQVNGVRPGEPHLLREATATKATSGEPPGTSHLPGVNVPRRSLAIHGPFEVQAADLTNAAVSGPVNPAVSFADVLPRIAIKLSDTAAGEPSGTQTPQATTSFVDTAGLSGIDPGIAVGSSYILVSDNQNGVAVYDKTGKLLGPTPPNSTFPNAFSVGSLFKKAAADINPLLNYPSGLPPGFSVANGNGIQGYGDVRVMFDSYRKRFWIYAMAKNQPSQDPKTIVKYPAVKLARRDKAVVAVSKTEDPRDGFYTYWWNETIHNGECNDPVGCSDPIFKGSGEGADYPSLGLSPRYFLATIGVNRRDPSFKTDTEALAKAWVDCKTSFEANGKVFNWCGPFYIHLMAVDADTLAKGCPGRSRQLGGVGVLPCPSGRSFGLFVDADNYVTDRTEGGDFAAGMGRGVKPVVMHGAQVKTQIPTTVHSADAYFVNNFIDRSGKEPRSRLVLWSLVGDDLIPTIYHIRPFTYDSYNDWKFVLNASYRNGNLYANFNECWPSFKDGCMLSVRLLRINTLNSQTEIDRSFGVNSTFDDKSSDRFHYRFPGIEANKHGDIVVVYSRYSTDKPQSQEVRFSVWYHNEPNIRPSRRLHVAEAVGAWGTDTAGIAVDPADDEAIWIAHIFAAKNVAGNGYRRIAVGKVFGEHQRQSSELIKKP